MSEKLVNIMIVLSMYLEERLACALFHIIFESNKQSLEFLNVSLNKLYKNKIALPYEVSKWKITKVYKAVFKWLTVKLDSFSINGVTFEVLEQIYKSTVQNLSSDPQDSKNETIQAASYKFMHALNEKREDFANLDSENDQDEDQDQLYQFNSKKMRSVDIEMDQKALKNNFVSIEENQESEPEDDSPHEAGTTPNFDEQIHDHPLKAKFFESFNEIRKARSKIIVNKELNFLKILLNDSSISDFSLTEDEFRSILECCAAALNITNANSKDNFSMLEILILLKKVPINIEDELYDDIRIKARLMLSVFVSPMQEIIEIGLDDILADFYGLLNSYTLELKKVDVCQILADIDYIDDKDDKFNSQGSPKLNYQSFKVHFRWLTSQIISEFYLFHEIKPLIPLLVSCLDSHSPHNEMNSQEINTLRAEVADFFTKMFDTFGHEKVKRDIEVMLLKNQKLYAVFFEWFYSEGFVQSTGDKPNNKRDVLLEQTKKNSNKFEIEVEQHVRDVRGSANERIDTKFNLEKGYKVVESRPKTTAMGLMASISEDRKDVNFDLSPSQTNSNSKHELLGSNLYTNTQDDDAGTKIAQFLTEEKNYESVTSKYPRTSHQDLDNETIPNSARMSEIRPEDISDRYESRRNVPDSPENRKIDYEIIKSKIEDERNALNREWEQRLKLKEDEHIRTMEALEKANEHYSQQLSERDRLRSELDQQKQFNEQIIEKYEKALQNSIDAIKKQKDLESKIEQEKLELAQQAPYSAIRRYAEENIQNPMDLSMSLVIKESSTTATPSNKIVINTDPLHKLESIFEKQKSIAKGDYSESDDEEAQTANTFKFQEFLIETDNAQDIAQSLILVYMKNRTSKDKNTMLQSMINALSNEDHDGASNSSDDVLMSLTDVHFH